MVPSTMKAALLRSPGGPSAFTIETLPVPAPAAGQVLIHVRARGLNRSELFTRQGHSPGVHFPRVLGIEAVGAVAACPGGEFAVGATVATAMGGLGRAFDGGYAEYVCVDAGNVQAVPTTLGWDALGALPEMLQTAWGALFVALDLQRGETLLIRGGTTSVGLAAAALATRAGARVAATSRRAASTEKLAAHGADAVFVDDSAIAEKVRARYPDGVDKVLELVGVATLRDSLRCARVGGVVCQTGIVGNKWTLEELNPMEFIPTGVRLTVYAGGVAEFMRTPLSELAAEVEAGRLKVPVGKTFRLEQMVEAHEAMEGNLVGGKIVVLS